MSLNLASYGSQVLSSGDLVVRDVNSSSQMRVADVSSEHSSYVLSQGDALEASREIHSYDSDKLTGRYTSSCLRTHDELSNMAVTFETDPEKTNFNTGETSATFSQGLSFNTDESAIYFGGSKTFRVMLSPDTPSRLVFQYLDPSTSEYVTKFSCAKS